jgi:hypothetical protein
MTIAPSVVVVRTALTVHRSWGRLLYTMNELGNEYRSCLYVCRLAYRRFGCLTFRLLIASCRCDPSAVWLAAGEGRHATPAAKSSDARVG